MMQTTHGLAGMALALPVALAAPELSGFVLLAGLAGGAFPDLDLYRGHRRTLHFPVAYPVAAALVGVVAVAVPAPASIAVAVFASAAALHCLMDIFGGGLELRPWEQRSQRAVYDHARGRWISPRRWIRYDGSPEDLGIAAVAAAPVVSFADGAFATAALTLLAVSAVYVAFRRRLPDVAAFLAPKVPPTLQGWVPNRYHE